MSPWTWSKLPKLREGGTSDLPHARHVLTALRGRVAGHTRSREVTAGHDRSLAHPAAGQGRTVGPTAAHRRPPDSSLPALGGCTVRVTRRVTAADGGALSRAAVSCLGRRWRASGESPAPSREPHMWVRAGDFLRDGGWSGGSGGAPAGFTLCCRGVTPLGIDAV